MVDRTGSTEFNTFALHGQTLDIIVENQGRLNYGAQINDNKKVCTEQLWLLLLLK